MDKFKWIVVVLLFAILIMLYQINGNIQSVDSSLWEINNNISNLDTTLSNIYRRMD